MSINVLIITGNLTRDPEYKVTSGGRELLEFSVAVNDRVRGEDGKVCGFFERFELNLQK